MIKIYLEQYEFKDPKKIEKWSYQLSMIRSNFMRQYKEKNKQAIKSQNKEKIS